jgi:hypothetical protein
MIQEKEPNALFWALVSGLWILNSQVEKPLRLFEESFLHR